MKRTSMQLRCLYHFAALGVAGKRARALCVTESIIILRPESTRWKEKREKQEVSPWNRKGHFLAAGCG